MERINFLPLGSVVLLEGGTQKLMIVSRGLNVEKGGQSYFFDYSGVIWPVGVNGPDVYYFNHPGVAKVCFYGCVGDEDTIMVNELNKYLEANPDLKRITPEEWNKIPE